MAAKIADFKQYLCFVFKKDCVHMAYINVPMIANNSNEAAFSITFATKSKVMR